MNSGSYATLVSFFLFSSPSVVLFIQFLKCLCGETVYFSKQLLFRQGRFQMRMFRPMQWGNCLLGASLGGTAGCIPQGYPRRPNSQGRMGKRSPKKSLRKLELATSFTRPPWLCLA